MAGQDTTSPAAGRPVEADRPCMRCGYSLRGLVPEGCCPECGTAVAWSLRGDLLRYAAPEYVARLATGARLVWWSIALTLMAGIAAVPFTLLAGPMFALPTMLLLTCGMYLGGWWLLSSPDPAQAEQERNGVRVVLRGAMAAAIAAFLSEAVFVMTPGPVPSALAVPLAFFGATAAMVSFVASLLYLRRLAPRLPDPALRKRAGALIWLSAILAAGVVVVVAADAFAPSFGAPTGFGRVPISCGLLMLELVFIVMYAGMLDRVKSQLNAVLKEVRSRGPGAPP